MVNLNLVRAKFCHDRIAVLGQKLAPGWLVAAPAAGSGKQPFDRAHYACLCSSRQLRALATGDREGDLVPFFCCWRRPASRQMCGPKRRSASFVRKAYAERGLSPRRVFEALRSPHPIAATPVQDIALLRQGRLGK
jgi:hypothetical protein